MIDRDRPAKGRRLDRSNWSVRRLIVDRSRSTIINRNKKMAMMNEIFLWIRIAICLIKLIKSSMGSVFSFSFLYQRESSFISFSRLFLKDEWLLISSGEDEGNSHQLVAD